MMVQRVSTNNFACAKWIVDANGVSAGATHSTIAGAIADAVSGETILVKPGTYTENATLKAGVNICGMPGEDFSENVKIIGKLLHNTAGTCTLSSLALETNSDFAIEVSGTEASILRINNCTINAEDNTAISLSSSGSGARLDLYNCLTTVGADGNALFTKTDAVMRMFYCDIRNTSTNTTPNTNTDSLVIMFSCRSSLPFSITGAGSLTMDFCRIETLLQDTTCLTFNTSSDSSVFKCSFRSGSASSLSISGSGEVRCHECLMESSNANTITGTGTIRYGLLQSFGTGGLTINTTTQTPRETGPRILLSGGAEILAGSGDPSGSVTAPQGSLFLRTDGSSTSTRAYINTNGTTGWTSITTAS